MYIDVRAGEMLFWEQTYWTSLLVLRRCSIASDAFVVDEGVASFAEVNFHASTLQEKRSRLCLLARPSPSAFKCKDQFLRAPTLPFIKPCKIAIAIMAYNSRMSQQYQQSSQKGGGRGSKQQQQKEQDEFILLVSAAPVARYDHKLTITAHPVCR